jgi:quinol monooxygenase YgiN
MAGFVQIIEYTTSRFDEIMELADKLRAGGQGGPAGAVSVTVTEDRDKPGHFFTVAEFESYEKAMENSNNPATQEFAAAMAKLVDGEPTFYNLDVRDRM